MIKVTAVKHFRNSTIGLYVDDFPNDQCAKCRTVTEFVYKEREMFEADETPAPVELDQTAAQVLMDSLWDCGVRPTEGSGSAGSFAAQGKHLADMQRLVFDHLVVKKRESITISED